MVYNTIILYKESKSNTLTITIDQITIDQLVFGYTYTTKEGVFGESDKFHHLPKHPSGLGGKLKNLKHKPLSSGTNF